MNSCFPKICAIFSSASVTVGSVHGISCRESLS